MKGQMMSLGEKESPHSGMRTTTPEGLTRARLIRLLQREQALPQGWEEGHLVPRHTVRALVLACRQERDRLRLRHWTASLSRFLALQSALASAFALRSSVKGARSRKAGNSPQAASDGLDAMYHRAERDGPCTIKNRPGNRGGPDPR